MTDAPLDLLAIGAHPDDIELFAGGTIAMLTASGRRVGVLSMTRGECGTRGTPESRAAEAAAADAILGVATRVTLDLGDGRLENTHDRRAALAAEIRRLRPRVVLTHDLEERHPDHGQTHRIVRDACFFANVGGFDAPGPRHAIEELVFFMGHEVKVSPRPDWIVEIAGTHAKKMEAVRAYASQFLDPDPPAADHPTYISTPGFWAMMDARSRLWGHLAGGVHGEAFIFRKPAHAAHAFVRMIAGGAP